MKRIPQWTLALIAAIAALALPACGGDDDESTGGGGALSDEAYAERTEAALQTIVDLDELSKPLAEPESVEQYVAGVRGISTKVDGAADELDAIEPPEKVASLHDELVTAVKDYGAAFTPVADAAEAGDEAALQTSAKQLQDAAAGFQQAATDLDARFRDEGIELNNLL